MKGGTMRITSAAAATLAVAFGLLAGPAIASADNSARDVITDLRGQGYHVVIDRMGSGPMEDCVVTDIRNPTEMDQMRIGVDRREATPTRQTVTVSLSCSR